MLKDVAPCLIGSTPCEDGIIEAVEAPSKKFALGVQWHPEGTWKEDLSSKKLFRAFVQAASKGPGRMRKKE